MGPRPQRWSRLVLSLTNDALSTYGSTTFNGQPEGGLGRRVYGLSSAADVHPSNSRIWPVDVETWELESEITSCRIPCMPASSTREKIET